MVGERYLFSNAAGQELVVLASAAPLWDRGAVRGAVSVWHDDTERERLLAQLREANERLLVTSLDAQRWAAQLTGLIGSMREAATVVDREGNFVLRNDAAVRLSGVARESVTSWDEYTQARVINPDGTPLPREFWPNARLLRGEPVVDLEYLLERADGSRRRCLANGTVIRDADGEVALGIVVTRDVTEVRRLEETREDFVRAITHDLRQPLTVIQGQAQLLSRFLQRDKPDERLRRALEGVNVSARRMGQMIADLAEAASWETAQATLELRALDLRDYVAEIVGRLQAGEGAARLRLEPTVEPLPPVLADPERLERVVTNLLGNALKYSPPDAPVSVSLVERADAVVFSVRDQGRGIAASDLPHLFERYYRSLAMRESKSDGLGLGLYIARLIVEGHGGKLWVESEARRGQHVLILLACGRPDRRASKRGAATQQAGICERPAARRCSVGGNSTGSPRAPRGPARSSSGRRQEDEGPPWGRCAS